VLVTLAKLLRHSLRSTDIVARWGGEEFIVLFPRSTLPEAVAVAEKVRGIIASADFPVVGHKTVSMGVATLRQGESIEQWTTRADEALYRAKTGGRNAVCADND
jgi:diguanylate cyclase (GGDEF)-like protein